LLPPQLSQAGFARATTHTRKPGAKRRAESQPGHGWPVCDDPCESKTRGNKRNQETPPPPCLPPLFPSLKTIRELQVAILGATAYFFTNPGLAIPGSAFGRAKAVLWPLRPHPACRPHPTYPTVQYHSHLPSRPHPTQRKGSQRPVAAHFFFRVAFEKCNFSDGQLFGISGLNGRQFEGSVL